jgi:uracil-DNA glycosylase
MVILGNVYDSEPQTILEAFNRLKDTDWNEFVTNRDIEEIIRRIDANLRGKLFYPRPNEVFRFMHLTSPYTLKVVIVGQDPYKGIGNGGLPKATGITFSCRRKNPIQPSLKKIYDELERTVPQWVRPTHGDISCWCFQGVMLVNKAITISDSKSEDNFHHLLWHNFLVLLLEYISNNNNKVVLGLVGSKAQALHKGRALEKCNFEYIRYVGHPSPLNTGKPFVGSNFFIEINDCLNKQDIESINWAVY